MEYYPTAGAGGQAIVRDIDAGTSIVGPSAIAGVIVAAQGMATLTASRHISIVVIGASITIYAEMNRYWA
jgi:hypothetical protein